MIDEVLDFLEGRTGGRPRPGARGDARGQRAPGLRAGQASCATSSSGWSRSRRRPASRSSAPATPTSSATPATVTTPSACCCGSATVGWWPASTLPREPGGGGRRRRSSALPPGALLRPHAGVGSGGWCSRSRRPMWTCCRSCCPRPSGTCPQRGTARRWLDLADQNARHLLESLRIESFETDERAEDPVYALGRDLGLSIVPRSMICVDISTNQGRDTVGLAGLVRGRAGPRRASTASSRSRASASRTTSPRSTRSSPATSPAGATSRSRSPT